VEVPPVDECHVDRRSAESQDRLEAPEATSDHDHSVRIFDYHGSIVARRGYKDEASKQAVLGVSRWQRVVGMAGILSALLFLAGLFLLDLDDVGGDASRVEVVSTYSAGSTERKKEIGATLVGFAIFFLLFFLGRLRSAVRTAEGEGAVFSSAAFAGGILFAALLGVSAALDTAVASTEGFFENYQVDADTPLVLVSMSNWARGFATIGGGVLVGATSVVALARPPLPALARGRRVRRRPHLVLRRDHRSLRISDPAHPALAHSDERSAAPPRASSRVCGLAGRPGLSETHSFLAGPEGMTMLV
jgi:hypothetical protein